ncbi:recombinase family protein [Streptomyces sp. WZ-12]|uniref:recombinase family protein n=1 Tax=Streptomyces sp. WZ-12 TaxID=3030210 RepID=UPI002381083D|nr:recombinase family protein [Streptomyces sp. WZ-12]
MIVTNLDRLARDNRHLEDAIEVVENFGRPIIDSTGSLDLLTGNGRTVARIVTATNGKQSADTAHRVARKHRAPQQVGIPAGGTGVRDRGPQPDHPAPAKVSGVVRYDVCGYCARSEHHPQEGWHAPVSDLPPFAVAAAPGTKRRA